MNVMPSRKNATHSERASSVTTASRTNSALVTDPPTRPLPAAHGRYRLEKSLGSGSSATVWRARDTKTGRKVAIKQFHPHLVGDAAARDRIEREALAARSLSHPNIVSAIDTISSDQEVALVFPFVGGTSLAQRLEGGKSLTAREAAAIASDIASALAVAHEARLVHRDVKPANILIGDDKRARLLDFGISHTLAADIEAAHELTGPGMTIGTLPYMAPEQLTGEATTPATDVYALGVVLYEMLAGARPFQASSPVALAAEQRVPPARIDGQPAELIDQVLEALAFEPAARPSASQFAQVLRGWLDGRTDPNAPTTVVPVVSSAGAATLNGAGRASRFNHRQVAAGVAGIGLSMAVTAVLAFGPGGMQPAAIGDESAGPTPNATPVSSPTPVPVAPAGVEQKDGEQGANSGGGNSADPDANKDKKEKKGKRDRGRGNDDDDDDDD